MTRETRETPSDAATGPADRSTIGTTVNGEQRSLLAGSTVRDLLQQMDVDPAQSGIAVAVDEAVVPRSEWSSRTLEEGSLVEVITATQGG